MSLICTFPVDHMLQ